MCRPTQDGSGVSAAAASHGHRQCRLFEEARHRGLVEERLHVASKRLVARAGFRQKRGTFCGRALECVVVEPLDQSPAL